MRFDALAGKRVVVWGAGREGRAALAELTRRGVPAVVAVTGDGAVPEDLAGVTTTADAALERLVGADVVVKSPGIPRASREFREVAAAGVAITSLTDLWLNENRDRVIGVTGTKGKSTTSAVVHHVLQAAGISSSLVGNLGVPVTEGDRDGSQVAVTEVSSYQAAELSSSPRVAVVTSLYPEHLPWHGGFEQYVADKLNLVAHGPDVVVVPDDDGELGRLVGERVGSGTRVISPAGAGLTIGADGIRWEGVGTVPPAEIPLRGAHNVRNLTLALTAAGAFVDFAPAVLPELLGALRTFAPLSHRLETVPSADGRTWVDDSLATAPEAVVAALEAYPTARTVLLFGGEDRGLSFAPLVDYLARRDETAPVATIAVGPAGARFYAEAGARLGDVWLAPSFAAALDRARVDADRSDLVLLSPGAPSFDEFTSYEQRSEVFRAAALRGATD